MQVYGKLHQSHIDVIIKEVMPVWYVRLLIYKEGELVKKEEYKDTSFLPVSDLPPVEEFQACVEYVAIRGQILSTCDIEMVVFTSAAKGNMFVDVLDFSLFCIAGPTKSTKPSLCYYPYVPTIIYCVTQMTDVY